VAIDLLYEPDSLAGPPDTRVLDKLANHRYVLDRGYLEHIGQFHGGIPGKGYFTTPGNRVLRIGRFLTLYDSKSLLVPPPRPSWAVPGRDIRIDYSAYTLIYEEGNSCRNLFAGDELLPFAALYYGPHHPDGMDLTDGQVDLMCFFYSDKAAKKGRKRPRIVRWDSDLAHREYRRWEEEMRADENAPVLYDTFLETIAPNFDSFLKMLRESP
jgi:hypothetical protein